MKKRKTAGAVAQDSRNVIHVSFSSAVEAALQNLEPHRIRLLSQVEGVMHRRLGGQARHLLEERFGFNDPEPKTVSEIADECGKLPEEIQALEIEALRALRGHPREAACEEGAAEAANDSVLSPSGASDLYLKALANKLLLLKGGQS